VKSISDQDLLLVGIVGANSERGWGKEAHVPALQKLPGLNFAAVATRSQKSARAAAEAFGTEYWYDDAFALVRNDEIDVVSICVKVPEHRKILLAGTGGRLSLIGGDSHGFQGGELRLEGDPPFAPPDPPVVTSLPREAANVAEVYARLAYDIRNSTWTVPDFKHAVQLTRLIDTVSLAAKTGIRQEVAGSQYGLSFTKT
jgi:predicted dehydrogenase